MNVGALAIIAIGLVVTGLIAAYSWNKLRAVSYLVLAWLVLAVGLAQIPYLQVKGEWQSGDLIGFMFFSILLMIPLAGLFIAWQKSSAFKNFLDAVPTWVLVSTQAYRIVGLAFLFYYFQGALPFEVGFVSGVYDLLVASSAVVIAWLLYHKSIKEKLFVVGWCGFGLLDFAVAFTIVGLSFLGLIQLVPEPTAMAMPPLTIISIFQVPLAIFIHVYLITRVLQTPSIPSVFVTK